MLILNSKNFDQEVLQSKIPVLVDFYADWCGPCRMMGPVIEEFAKENEGKVKVAKVNVDNENGLAEKYGVMSIPTTIAFKEGKEAGRQVGVVDKTKLEEMVK